MTVAYSGTSIRLELPVLAAGERATVRAPAADEAAVILLSGSVSWGDRHAARLDVFEARASAVYLPPETSVEVSADAPTELALAVTACGDVHADDAATPVFIAPDDVVVHERGQPGWRRHVHDVVADAVPATRLLVGETFNAPGEWSSFPPHKHDGHDGEPALEEVYYYRFDKPDGFGFQGLYETGGQERAIFLRHGAVVGIPRGYHPVCAAPGYRLYYLWALVGARRALAMYEDPAHRWLHEARSPGGPDPGRGVFRSSSG
jgi:5-deoxy-glucuronate isomerase